MKLDQAKLWFFDDVKVIQRVEKARLRVLSKFGAYVRTYARSSMRRRKKPSAPGTPPSAQSTDPYATLKTIFFSYDASSDSVVVGPVLLNGSRNSRFKTVPELHEKGGVTIGRDGKLRRYPERPFMLPSVKQNAPKFPELFAGSVGE